MTSSWDDPQFQQAVEGMTAIVTSPLILFAAATLRQPAVQDLIREGLVLSERAKEAVAQMQETIEDLSAEAQEKLASEPRSQRTWVREGESDIAASIQQVMSTLDEQVGRITNGTADLRLLVPMGLGALALKQLIDKGFQLDEMPWYTLAWYAFDTFVKLNNPGETLAPIHPETED